METPNRELRSTLGLHMADNTTPIEDEHGVELEAYDGDDDPHDDDPRYPWQRVADYLRALIVEGNLKPGARLPKQRELTDMFDTAPRTVSKAVRKLIEEGLVISRAGSGVYVRDPHNTNDETRLARIAHLLKPCPPPVRWQGRFICRIHPEDAWPCPVTQAAWLARGMDPAYEGRRVLAPLYAKSA